MKTSILPLALLLLAGCEKSNTAAPATNAVPPAAVTTSTAHLGDVTRSITQPGNVRAWQEATLYAKVSGYLRASHADIGDTIEKDTLLATLLAYARITAPFTGVITARHADPGAFSKQRRQSR